MEDVGQYTNYQSRNKNAWQWICNTLKFVPVKNEKYQ